MTSPLMRPSLHALSSPLPIFALGFTLFAVEPAPAAGSAADPFSGTYDVLGTTVDVASGDTRRIEGHVVLTLKNGHYQAASELTTDFPTQGGPVHTDVIGTGDGERHGEVLSGTAKTQLVIQTVPGVDTNFAFIPRQVGPRIVSSWKAHLDPDGTLIVELSNKAEKGEVYRPTTTTLRGKRVGAPGQAGKQP
jgi:hypothetical protein